MSGRHGQCLSCVDRIFHPFAHQQQQQHPHCAHSLLLPVGGLLLRRRHLPCRLALGRLHRLLHPCGSGRGLGGDQPVSAASGAAWSAVKPRYLPFRTASKEVMASLRFAYHLPM